jgi:hypothetical protein
MEIYLKDCNTKSFEFVKDFISSNLTEKDLLSACQYYNKQAEVDKLFISKNTPTTCWISEGEDKIEKPLSSNISFYFYDLKEPQKLTFNLDEVFYERELSENEIVEFEVDSNIIKNIKLIDTYGEHDYSTIYKEIDRNLIYLGN